MAGVLLLLLWPIWEFQYPTMVDYPSHLAQVEILRDWNHDAFLQQRYSLTLRPFPNLALDLLGVYAFSWLDVPAAGKTILTLLIFLFWAGCHCLGCAAGRGRPVWLAAVAALLVYNSTFLYGYVNCNFGIALFFLALPAWLWYRRKRSLPRMLAVSSLATAAYLAHWMGIGALAIAMTFLVARDWRAVRRWRKALAVDLIPLAPPAALYASLGRNRGGGAIVWGSLAQKATHLMAWLTGYNAGLTVLYFLAWVIAAAIVLLTGRRRPEGGFLALGALFSLLAVVAPGRQLFSAVDADARLVIPAVAVTLLALAVDMPPFFARAAFLIVLCTMCARVIEIRHYWKAGDALTRAQVELLRPVPRGGMVFPIVRLPGEVELAKRERHIWHAVEYATVDRLVFFPQILSFRGQQPVLLRGAYPEIEPDMPPEAVPWDAVLRNYDFIYTYGVDETCRKYLDGRADQVGASGKGRIYRISKRFAEGIRDLPRKSGGA